MLRQLGQRLGREMRPDRVILQFSAELVTDLLVNRVNDFLAGKHRANITADCADAKAAGWGTGGGIGRGMVSSPIARFYKTYWQNQDALFVGSLPIDTLNAFGGGQPSLRLALL
jgi:hypothetical protein